MTKNSQPLVSILMLTHNRAEYIAQAIESVLSQTYQHFELIIIDDGSTDATYKIISAYTDKRIRLVQHDKNHGLHSSRSESLQYAKGTYIAVLDSDDLWISLNKLHEQVTYMQEHTTCAVVGTYINLIDADNTHTGSASYHTTDKSIRAHILRRNQFTHSSVVMRQSALEQTQGYRDTTLAEDLDLFLQLGNHGDFANIPKHMTAYRIHNESFNPQRTDMAKAVLGIIRNHKDTYPGYHIALVKAYVRILANLLIHGR